MTDVNPPKIEGARETEVKDEVKTEKDMVMDQAIHMDMVTSLPVDENPIYPDFVGVTPQDKLIEESKEALDNTNHVKVNATVKKARKSRKVIKDAAALEGTAGKQGTPIPDKWNEYMERQEQINSKMMSMLEDMRLTRGEAAPLQDQQIIPPQEKTEIIEDPIRPQTMIAAVVNAKPEAIIIPEAQPPPQKKPRLKEQESYANRFSKAFKSNFNLVNKAVQNRAAQDPSMGSKPNNSTSNEVYF